MALKSEESVDVEPSSPAVSVVENRATNSQTSEGSPTVTNGAVPLSRWYPRFRGDPIYHGNVEAFGWCLDSIGRAVAFATAGAFLFPALLRLAKEAAGCETDPPPGSNKVPECNSRVYGIRPSSLLTTFTILVGVISAILLPVMGAIVDYTEKRLLVGKVTSIILCILLLPSLALSSETWFPIAILQLIVAFVGWAQTMVTYAYLPELTKSEERLNQYTQSFTIVSFSSMLLCLGFVVGISTLVGFDDDEVAVAQLGQLVAFATTTPLLYFAWFKLLKHRPASRHLPPSMPLWKAGFAQVFKSSKYINRNLPALKWFYISVMFIDAGSGSLATILITYLTDTLAFTTTENATAILAILIGSIPGAVASGYANRWWYPVKSSIVATAIMVVNTIAAAIILKGPGQQTETYILGLIWGLGAGWKWTSDRVLASTLIPAGQDAELMGVYLFAGQVLTWLPPLVFTAMNEAGVSQRAGIGTTCIWFVFGIFALFFIGDYRKAVSTVGREEIFLVDEEGAETSAQEE
mmetsp:Transcript_8388/g.11012  ORF Transcript_8388/g.11012 Transcript_8388/m.11012 type:complete len:522 (+) Transcript_8388:150-1715(+)|eukprot:CAMPEP_0198151274 /NCGR_PEP_ID=MMETSP1443-20131203/55018_1 /TAXON_ID=186043 /ORGANISM="Entomoneis sp., Strain CCMP2396" /LENGTH=521 /DNA_ID=CAMNT_0043816893 /DNA_START=114 /DNA_END=1679 /DNA_ORIENTATION=+